jgi:hypothetical protein
VKLTANEGATTVEQNTAVQLLLHERRLAQNVSAGQQAVILWQHPISPVNTETVLIVGLHEKQIFLSHCIFSDIRLRI